MIDKDKEIMKMKKYIERIKGNKAEFQAFKNVYDKMNIGLDAEEIINRKYDSLIMDIVQNGPNVILKYRYIIGTFLADKFFLAFFLN